MKIQAVITVSAILLMVALCVITFNTDSRLTALACF